jgi:uncharacterized protein (TIGR03790 family)
MESRLSFVAEARLPVSRYPGTLHLRIFLAFVFAILLVHPVQARADLTPERIVVVANRNVPEGIELANYYMKKRGVPLRNLLTLQTSRQERISREEYDRDIASPVRDFLGRNSDPERSAACLVLMYGIPLRIDSPAPSAEERSREERLQKRSEELQERARASEKESPAAAKALKEESNRAHWEALRAGKRLDGASVDSEIALVEEAAYSLEGWLPNKYFVLLRGKNIPNMPQKVLLVSRLDGPTPQVVRRVIDDSMQAEKAGLTGKAYFDARWPGKGDKNLSPYEFYDRAIHNAARVVEKSGRMPVVLDEKERLFQPGEAPDAALYCGWYSLAKYVDAFTWARGAVGYHIASSECTTLKAGPSSVWCKMMLEKGVAATIGPVAEPYVQAFPLPDVFFDCLLGGHELSVCYGASNPMLSWQMILIGDPLYRPFKPPEKGKQKRE